MPDFLLRSSILHVITTVLFGGMTIMLFVQAILSFLPFLDPAHPIIRFVSTVTSPILGPLRKRIPSMSLGMFDLSYTIALIFGIWSLGVVSALIYRTLPLGW